MCDSASFATKENPTILRPHLWAKETREKEAILCLKQSGSEEKDHWSCRFEKAHSSSKCYLRYSP